MHCIAKDKISDASMARFGQWTLPCKTKKKICKSTGKKFQRSCLLWLECCCAMCHAHSNHLNLNFVVIIVVVVVVLVVVGTGRQILVVVIGTVLMWFDSGLSSLSLSLEQRWCDLTVAWKHLQQHRVMHSKVVASKAMEAVEVLFISNATTDEWPKVANKWLTSG